MYVEPLKDKKTDSVIAAFKKIFARTEHRPQRMQSDNGGEFGGAKFKKYLNDIGIDFNTTNNPDTKASICERSIRTLKGRIFKYLTYNDTLTFIDRLPDFVKAYNNSYHSTIKMSPSAVNERNILQVYHNIKESQRLPARKQKRKIRVKVNVGDYVRISKDKNVFSKGYTKNFTSEIFKVKAVIQRKPVVYRLVDLTDEEIKGVFYGPEVQKVIFDESAKKNIEKIIKQKGTGKNLQYLVRFRNFGYKFDTWVKASDITK